MVCHNVEVYPWLFASTALPQIRLDGVCVAEISGPNPTGPKATFKFRHTLPLNVEADRTTTLAAEAHSAVVSPCRATS